jgi:hypothetical protein
MNTFWQTKNGEPEDPANLLSEIGELSMEQAESILAGLAETYTKSEAPPSKSLRHLFDRLDETQGSENNLPNLEAKYRALLEQLPAVVFMAYMDRGIGEAYVSPQIEATLGFSQAEWLEDPVLWYRQIHPEDKTRWSVEALRCS